MSDTQNQLSDSLEGTEGEGKATPHTTGFSAPVSFPSETGAGLGGETPLPFSPKTSPPPQLQSRS